MTVHDDHNLPIWRSQCSEGLQIDMEHEDFCNLEKVDKLKKKFQNSRMEGPLHFVVRQDHGVQLNGIDDVSVVTNDTSQSCFPQLRQLFNSE